jgi:hypothetical protein
MRRVPDFDGELDRLQDHMPDWASRKMERLRAPDMTWVRVPAGVAFIGGGIFSFLPVLGIWMLPLGLALLAIDVPPMRAPLARVLAFTNRKIGQWKGQKDR